MLKNNNDLKEAWTRRLSIINSFHKKVDDDECSNDELERFAILLDKTSKIIGAQQIQGHFQEKIGNIKKNYLDMLTLILTYSLISKVSVLTINEQTLVENMACFSCSHIFNELSTVGLSDEYYKRFRELLSNKTINHIDTEYIHTLRGIAIYDDKNVINISKRETPKETIYDLMDEIKHTLKTYDDKLKIKDVRIKLIVSERVVPLLYKYDMVDFYNGNDDSIVDFDLNTQYVGIIKGLNIQLYKTNCLSALTDEMIMVGSTVDEANISPTITQLSDFIYSEGDPIIRVENNPNFKDLVYLIKFEE